MATTLSGRLSGVGKIKSADEETAGRGKPREGNRPRPNPTAMTAALMMKQAGPWGAPNPAGGAER